MAKSKNHTSHHQNRKDHRNGIKRPKAIPIRSFEGQERKFVFNLRKSRRNNKTAKQLRHLQGAYLVTNKIFYNVLKEQKQRVAVARNVGQALLRKRILHRSNVKGIAYRLTGDRVRATLNRLTRSKKPATK